ncbi:MAG: HEPN domain-containing protein [Chloroflexi bacterium]|nr:HEPN domain-containing protein [Chloroflexota bacterium]
MAREESTYPQDWLAIAERDLDRVGRALRDGDAEAAAFFLQQTLEKSLKAFLLHNGWQLRRIHDLEALLDDAVDLDSSLESFRALCQRATGYYLIDRYPLPGVPPPPAEEVMNLLEVTQDLMVKIRAELAG